MSDTDKILLWTNASGQVRVAIPALPPLPGEPEHVWCERVAFATALQDPDLNGYTYLSGVQRRDLPPRGTHQIPGMELYVKDNGKPEEVYVHWREAWRYISGQGVRLVPAVLRQQCLARLREERNRRLRDSDGPAQFLGEQPSTSGRLAGYRQYRQQLRDLPGTAQADMAGLNFSGIVAYTPPWPVDPEA